jgi:hypothetical protein
MGKWALARAELQVLEWFGRIPDFILTFDASYATSCADAQFCAPVEHELSDCGVERDEFGAPRFKKSTSLPSFTLVGHDIVEFVGVVRRYGADATGVRALVDAANADAHRRCRCYRRCMREQQTVGSQVKKPTRG